MNLHFSTLDSLFTTGVANSSALNELGNDNSTDIINEVKKDKKESSNWEGGDPGLNQQYTIQPSIDSAFLPKDVRAACGPEPLCILTANCKRKKENHSRCVDEFNANKFKSGEKSAALETLNQAARNAEMEKVPASGTNKALIAIIVIVILLAIVGLIIWMVRRNRNKVNQ